MKLYGVFIGINEYEDNTIPKLRYAVRDAEQMKAIFEHSLVREEQELYSLTDEFATRKEILSLVGERLASKVSREDCVVVYFSGHGSPEMPPTNDKASRYLVTHDTERDHVFSTGIDLQLDLVNLFARLESKLTLFIADSCFSGAAGGRTFEGPRLCSYRQIMRAPLYLNSLKLGEGRIMIGACGDDEVARELPELRHGIFTHFLIQTLINPTNPISGIGITRLYDEVAEAVNHYTGGSQTPTINGRSSLARLPRLEIGEQL